MELDGTKTEQKRIKSRNKLWNKEKNKLHYFWFPTEQLWNKK